MPHTSTRVIATGTFDVVHPGHEFFLREAKKLGDWLGVIIARDETVEKIKGARPTHNETIRKHDIELLGIADVVVIGKSGDKYKILEELKPDIIALGYDQRSFTENLANELKVRGLSVQIIRIPAFQPETYKSSKIKKAFREGKPL